MRSEDGVTVLRHQLLTAPANYSLLFGRVHRTQRPLLNRLPQLSAGDRKRLIERWKYYAALAVDLYSLFTRGRAKVEEIKTNGEEKVSHTYITEEK